MVSDPRRPFVDYYRTHDISPVRQDIADLSLHFERRASLYRALGLVPAFLAGRSVIEFGPGSGHNALFTSSLRPRRYVLVDGNPAGLRQARALLDRFAPEAAACELVESLIEDFATDERFDLVLCEGTIPLQLDPPAFAKRLASFVAPGGVFVLTCQDAAVSLADLVRRLIAAALLPPGLSVKEQVERLRPIFADHLSALPGVSRPVDDWILDQITHPFIGEMFSVDDAVRALTEAGLDAYHASPGFFTVWRWYKNQVGAARSIGPDVASAYFRNVLNLMDRRLDGNAAHSVEFGSHLLEASTAFFHDLQNAERKTGDFEPAGKRLAGIAETIRPLAPITAASLDETLALCSAARRGADVPATPALREFWGHGQQYVSFVRS